MELMPRTRAMGGQGQRAGINLIDPIISRKAEKLEVASTLCQAKSQHSGLARTAAMEAEAEKAGICTTTHRVGRVPASRGKGEGSASPNKDPGRPGPLPSRGVHLAGSQGGGCDC